MLKKWKNPMGRSSTNDKNKDKGVKKEFEKEALCH